MTMLLIVSAVKKNAQAVSDMFYYMGVLSYASTPNEALTEISDVYRAVLIIEPEGLPDAENYINKIRSYKSGIPIFAVRYKYGPAICEDWFDGCFDGEAYSSTLVEEIVRYQVGHKLPKTAHYRLTGIDASCDSHTVTVFGKAVNFTKTETMILRYLIASYPIPQSAKAIVKYAFKPTRKPEITSIRTHISVMNKKFKEATGKTIFTSVQTLGYVILTPELLKEYQSAI